MPKKNEIMLDQYDIQENETPEIVADRHHGSSHYHWVVMLLNDISEVMSNASICGLGQAASNPILSVLKFFPEDVGIK